MKAINTVMHKLVRPSLFTAIGLLLCNTTSQAAKPEIWVTTSRNQWAQVIPGLGTAGRVIFSYAHGSYITDRVSRGEYVTVIWRASVPGEYGTNHGYRTTCGPVSYGATSLPSDSGSWLVPMNPACDNPRAWIQSTYEKREVTIPLGTRP